MSPALDGIHKREDEETPISFVLYEYEVHGNRYSTLRGKLFGIRSHLMAEGYPDPLLNKPTLDRHMRGIRALRGATEAKAPLPAESFRLILERSEGHSLVIRAAAKACVVGFFALLRMGEFATRDINHVEDYIIRRMDVTFFVNGRICAWNEPTADAVELFIPGSKTDQRKQGCTRMQYATGEEKFCPVKVLSAWFAETEGSAIPATAPLFSIPHGVHGMEWTVLHRETVVSIIKGAAVECRLPESSASTHSIRISGATALLLAGVSAEMVQLIGRWKSNVFQRYTRYKSELMKGVSTKMAGTEFAVRPGNW